MLLIDLYSWHNTSIALSWRPTEHNLFPLTNMGQAYSVFREAGFWSSICGCLLITLIQGIDVEISNILIVMSWIREAGIIIACYSIAMRKKNSFEW